MFYFVKNLKLKKNASEGSSDTEMGSQERGNELFFSKVSPHWAAVDGQVLY